MGLLISLLFILSIYLGNQGPVMVLNRLSFALVTILATFVHMAIPRHLCAPSLPIGPLLSGWLGAHVSVILATYGINSIGSIWGGTSSIIGTSRTSILSVPVQNVGSTLMREPDKFLKTKRFGVNLCFKLDRGLALTALFFLRIIKILCIWHLTVITKALELVVMEYNVVECVDATIVQIFDGIYSFLVSLFWDVYVPIRESVVKCYVEFVLMPSIFEESGPTLGTDDSSHLGRIRKWLVEEVFVDLIDTVFSLIGKGIILTEVCIMRAEPPSLILIGRFIGQVAAWFVKILRVIEDNVVEYVDATIVQSFDGIYFFFVSLFWDIFVPMRQSVLKCYSEFVLRPSIFEESGPTLGTDDSSRIRKWLVEEVFVDLMDTVFSLIGQGLILTEVCIMRAEPPLILIGRFIGQVAAWFVKILRVMVPWFVKILRVMVAWLADLALIWFTVFMADSQLIIMDGLDWIFDYLDGGRNYVQQVPTFVQVISITKRNSIPKRIFQRIDKPCQTSLEVAATLGLQLIRLGFVGLTVGIIAGGVWANDAWGSFWSWDPKECAALLNWLIACSYLHGTLRYPARSSLFLRTWLAWTWFCYFGANYFAGGQHAYLT